MATQEKLVKSIETLNQILHSSPVLDPSRKKEKISLCTFITEALSNPSIRVAPNYGNLLSCSIEVLLQVCGDLESDVCLIGDECLNRLIKATLDGNASKIQIELHKKIKENGEAKSLRAALWRFAELAHLIRPLKGKAYVSIFLPVLYKVIERQEESVHETLANSIPKIMKTLGNFMTDADVKALLKGFLNNIQSSSAVLRRTAANCILSICLNCKNSSYFLMYVFNTSVGALVPIDDSDNSALIIGVMGCLKLIIPHINNETNDTELKGSFGVTKESSDVTVVVDKYMQVYELCLFYLTTSDHNIINASLETLNIVLQYCSVDVKNILISTNGIQRSFLEGNSSSSLLKLKSPSSLSVTTTTLSGDELVHSESDLLDSVRPDIEKWIDESKLTVINVAYADTSSKLSPKNLPFDFDYVSFDKDSECASSLAETELSDLNKPDYMSDNMEKLVLSEKSSEKSCSFQDNRSVDTYLALQDIDIGTFTDGDVPLLYCIRLLSKSFLLMGKPGNLIPDKNMRVSVKSLALTCLSTIAKMYPEGFLNYLEKNEMKNVESQQISDILLYGEHADPQLRGILRTFVANFVETVIVHSGNNYKEWIMKNCFVDNEQIFEIKNLIDILVKGLEDESSTCSRQTIISLGGVLQKLLQSCDNCHALPILHGLPFIAENPYWLVKVRLLEILSNLCYASIYSTTGNSLFQNKILHSVLNEMLKDEDPRVRTTSSNSIVKIVPCLYFPQDSCNVDAAMYKAKQFRKEQMSEMPNNESDIGPIKRRFINELAFPFNKTNQEPSRNIDESLSRVVMDLKKIMLTTKSKFFIYGCIETLRNLSVAYPPTTYLSGWSCFESFSIEKEKTSVSPLQNGFDVYNLCLTLLTTSNLVYDLSCHINLLNFTGNIFAGVALANLKPKVGIDMEDNPLAWDMFEDRELATITEQFLSHTMRLLNIIVHVIENTVPSAPQNKTILANLPPSPIKRRRSDVIEKNKLLSPMKVHDDKGVKRIEFKTNSVAGFAFLPHYMKIYEVLKTAYTNYKITLDIENPGKFMELLQMTLVTLSQILEIGSLNESGPIAEELLILLQTVFILVPSNTVECVQQLLKSLFGANLTYTITNLEDFMNNHEKPTTDATFYQNIFQNPYKQMATLLKNLSEADKMKKNDDDTVMGYLHRKFAVTSRGSEKVLASYIRLFEPLVIKSLKQYTVTCDVLLQCKVLKLLCQLVQLKVNYCLLDSDQVFIGFVLKQFEFIEEGQMNLPGEIIPKIFDFLVHLSYAKQHSKSIINIPKIIQLCDGLMASGQPPLGYCIAALKPVVEDIFLLRNNSNITDFKELETTREVIFSMLLRLLEYPEVIDLLVLILNESKYCNDKSEKWLRWSKQTVESLLPMLKNNRIRINRKGALASIKQLVMVLNHQAFKPLQTLLAILFENPPKHENNLIYVNHWLGKVITLLLMISHIREDVLLSEIVDVQEEFSPRSVFRSGVFTSDPLNVTNATDIFSGVPPEMIFAKFLFRIIEIVSYKCVDVVKSNKENYLIQQFSDFLMFCLHMLQSGSHCKITYTAMSLFNDNSKVEDNDETIPIEEINSNFLYISSFYPNITFYWCYLLALLNYSDRKFWGKVMQVTDCNEIIHQLKLSNQEDSKSIMRGIVRTGGIITFCDYLHENMSDTEQLSWFLSNAIESLVDLSNEPPVLEFLTSLHRNSSTSNLLVQAVESKCLTKQELSFKVKVLKCIENAHPTQIGYVLKLLLSKLLDSRHLAISRLVANLASRKLEMLLTMTMEEVNEQLPLEDLNQIVDLLSKAKLVKRHETLVALLNKLATHFYDSTPLEFEQRRIVNPEYIRKLEINKNWFVDQIKHKCYDSNYNFEMAELLIHLDNEDLMYIIANKDFNKAVLKECIKVSVNKIKEENLKEEPVLLKVAVTTIMDIVSHVQSLIPRPHQVYNVLEREPSPSEIKYSNELAEIFSDEFVWSFLNESIPCVTYYIQSLPSFPLARIPDNYFEDFIKFAVICLESVSFMLDINKCKLIKYIVDALKCADVICKEIHLCGVLGLDTHTSWLCSAVNSLYKIVNYLLSESGSLPIVSKHSLKNTLENIETVSAGHCCYQLSVLVVWLEDRSNLTDIPEFILKPVKGLIVSFARLPLVNSYILTPPSAWKNGFTVELSGIFGTLVPALPIEFLREVEILEEFIFRITLLGWTSRQQFEETWMCLLSVLNAVSIEDELTSEANDIKSTSIAVKAITSLLVQTLYTPCIGNPNVSKILHVSRNRPFDTSLESVYRLKNVQNKLINQFNEYKESFNINKNLNNVFSLPNLEKINSDYSYGQLSIEYLMVASKITEVSSKNNYVAQIYKTREKVLEDSGLDLNSCLQFLLDLYSQFLASEQTSIRLLNEVIQSVLMISDLFTERAQYEWMLSSFLTLSKNHTIEDEVMHQYIIVGCCKAAAVLNPDFETYDAIKKIIVHNLKSAFIPCRIAALQGILYLLQGNIMGNTHIGALSDEMQLLLPIATDYIQCHTVLKTDVLSQSLGHTLTTWALAFYVIENIEENNLESQFITSVLQSASSVLQSKVSIHIQMAILKGLERLIIKKCLSNPHIEFITKITTENIKVKNSPITLSAIQLLLSCTYTNSLKKKGNELEDNPDNLVHLLEKVSLIFNFIKKGFPFEVQILCSILPDVLNYFFTPADILTKVLGEFLSQQQPHPKLLSSVVFKVFQNAITYTQLPLLQDWVVFSLSNFTNSFSMAMATWYLSCFFVSASTNPWLRSFFPYVQVRIGRFEYEDRKMLCIAGVDFYKKLTNEKQRQTFVESFNKVKDQIDSPFNDLLGSVLLVNDNVNNTSE